MERATTILLRVGLLLSAIAAVVYLVRILVGAFLPVEWFWGGAVACLLGPALLATALRLSTGYPIVPKERS